MSKTYAIVDLETTGGRAARDRITEIAIILHDGEKELDRFESLINPGRAIPYNITQITGINDKMVADAPMFHEVAKRVVEITEGAIFVAHNVRFDYGFLKEEFGRLGYTYTRRNLCTVRLSRKAFPGLRSYSLGNLIKHFGIKVKDRHRAMADTQATVELFERILHQDESEEQILDMVNLGVRQAKLPANITLEKLHALPDTCGVYYFYNEYSKIIYVGKSKNIRKRVMSHFAKQTEKSRKLYQAVHEITCEETGSELVALLYESHEIKNLHPEINRAQRARATQFVIHQTINEDGYIALQTARVNQKLRKTMTLLGEYSKLGSAKGALGRIVENFELCHHLCHMDHTGKPCFQYHIKKCRGACAGKETAEEYNERVLEAVAYLRIDFPEDFMMIDQGRSKEEKAVILVEGGQYKGFGYLSVDDNIGDVDTVREAIKSYAHNRDVTRIIRQFLYKGEMKVIKLSPPCNKLVE